MRGKAPFRFGVLVAVITTLAATANADAAPSVTHVRLVGGVTDACGTTGPTGNALADALIAQACSGNPIPNAYPCVDDLDVGYVKMAATIDGATVKTFVNLSITADLTCRAFVEACVVLGLIAGGAPPAVLGFGGPVDGDPTHCHVASTSPRADGPRPTGMIIITGVYMGSSEAAANWHGWVIP